MHICVGNRVQILKHIETYNFKRKKYKAQPAGSMATVTDVIEKFFSGVPYLVDTDGYHLQFDKNNEYFADSSEITLKFETFFERLKRRVRELLTS